MLKVALLTAFISPLLLSLALPQAAAQSLQCKELFHTTMAPRPHADLILQLQALMAKGKNAIRSQKFKEEDKHTFLRLLSLSEADLRTLSNRDLLDIYKTFASWNFVPARAYNSRLISILAERLDSWTSRDYLSFATSRKLSPAPVSKYFLNRLRRNIIRNFKSFDVVTQMEVLGAELFHQTMFSIKDLTMLLTSTAQSLSVTERPIQLKPLKELYRGLLLLRATEPTVFFSALARLEKQLERQMNMQSLSLSQDGTSGADNLPIHRTVTRLRFERRMDDLFGPHEKIYEFSDPARLGFYDPVDIVYFNRKIVAEWDGRQHYFRNISMTEDGSLLQFDGNILRPMDQIKDTILRRQGFRVLRISYLLNEYLDTVNILELIREQNP